MSMLAHHRLFFRCISVLTIISFLPSSVQAWYFLPQAQAFVLAADDGPMPLPAEKLEQLAANTDGVAPQPLSEEKREQLSEGATAPAQLAQAEGVANSLSLAITPDGTSPRPSAPMHAPENTSAPKPHYLPVPQNRKPLPDVDAFLANLQLPEEERVAQAKILLAQASDGTGLLTGGFDPLYYLADPNATPAAAALIGANDLLKAGQRKEALLAVLDVMERHTRTAPVIDAQTQFNEVFDSMMELSDSGDDSSMDEFEATLPADNDALLRRYQSVESRYVLQEFYQFRVTQALGAGDAATAVNYARKAMDLADRTMKESVGHTLQSDITHYYYDTAKMVGGETYAQAIDYLRELANAAGPSLVSWTARLLVARVDGRERRDGASAILGYGSMLDEMESAGIQNALDDDSAYTWLQAAIQAEIAEIYFNLRDFENAKVHYDKVLTYRMGKEPKMDALFNLAYIAEMQYPDDPNTAIQMYQGFINKYPDGLWVSDALLRMAGLYHINGDYEHAVQIYTEVVQKHPEKDADVTAQAAIDYIFANQWDSYEVATGQPAPDADTSKLAMMCGPQALQKMLELKGIETTVDALAALANTDDTGTNMAGLVSAAKELGIELTGVRANQISELEAPFIAFLNGNHFVLVAEVADATLTIHDSGRPPVQAALPEFLASWNGEALIASKSIEIAQVLTQAVLEQYKGGGGPSTPPPPADEDEEEDDCPPGTPSCECEDDDDDDDDDESCGSGRCRSSSGSVGSPGALSGFDSPGVNASIDTFETSLSLKESDLSIGLLGALSLEFGRNYSSDLGYHRAETSSITKPWENNIGAGWSHGLNIHLRTSTGTVPTTAVYWDSSGDCRTYTFDLTTGGYNTYKRSATANPSELGNTLKRNTTTGKWSLEFANGTVLNFSATATIDKFARIESMSDDSGNTTTFEYNGAVGVGKLTKVVSPSGDIQHMVLAYSGNLITKVELKKNSTVLNSVAYAYNASNELTRVTDHASKTVDYSYGSYLYAVGSRYITKITNKSGEETDLTWTFGYSSGYKASKIDVDNAEGLTTTYDRSLTTNVCTVTNWDGATLLDKLVNTPLTGNTSLSSSIDYYVDAIAYERWSYEYDADKNKTKVVAPGSVTYGTYTYNSMGKVLTEQIGTGPTTTYAYDASGLNLTKITDAAGVETNYYYDSNNRLTKKTHPSLAAAGILLAYDANDNMTRMTGPTGILTDLEYDPLGRNTKVIRDSGGLNITSTSYYDDLGNKTRVTDPRGKDTYLYYGDVTCSACGGEGQLTKVKDALNNELTWEYDAEGLLTKYLAQAGVATSYEYDSMRRMTKVIQTSGGLAYATISYNLLGQITSETSFEGNISNVTYDHMGRPTKVTDPIGDVVYSLTSLGQPSTVTDSLNHVTTNEYDGAFRLTKVTDAIGKVTVYTYDSYGRVTKVGAGSAGTIDPTILYIDSATGGLSKVEYGSSTYAASYFYDDAAQLTKMTDWLNSSDGLRYEHDNMGRMTQLTDYDGSTLNYIYDDGGNILTCVDYHGNTSTYSYNDIGQVSTVTAPGGKTWTYMYDGDSRLTKVDMPNGMHREYGYDARGRNTKVHHKDGAAVKQSFDYGFNNDGRVTKVTHDDSSYWAYYYDGRDRMTKAERHDDTPSLLHRYTYIYDDEDNLLTKAVYDAGASTTDTTTFVYNNANEQTSMVNGAITTSMTYDAWGRLTSKAQGPYSASYGYRYGSRLYNVTSNFPGEGTVTYETGGDGKRRSRIEGLDETWYNWSMDWWVISEEDDADGASGSLKRSYVGNGLAHVDGSIPSAGAYKYYSLDNLGSTRSVWNEDKSILAEFEYGPYGSIYSETGSTGAIDKRFTGFQWDDATNLYSAVFRSYSPQSQRWLTRDPLGMIDGPNVYAYVGGDPTSRTDYFGLSFASCAKDAANRLGRCLNRALDSYLAKREQINRNYRDAMDRIDRFSTYCYAGCDYMFESWSSELQFLCRRTCNITAGEMHTIAFNGWLLALGAAAGVFMARVTGCQLAFWARISACVADECDP